MILRLCNKYAIICIYILLIFLQINIVSLGKEENKSNLEGLWIIHNNSKSGRYKGKYLDCYLYFNNNSLIIGDEGGGISYAIIKTAKNDNIYLLDIDGDISKNLDYNFHYKGIYRIDKNRLQIYWNITGSSRPKVLSTKPMSINEEYIDCRKGEWDSNKMEGKWRVVDAKDNGKEINGIKGNKWIINANKNIIFINGITGNQLGYGNKIMFGINQFVSPKEISVVIARYDNNNVSTLFTKYGIYDINNTRLILYFSSDNKKLSLKDISNNQGKKYTTYILDKVLKEKKE
jgi:uncharacterized protein (TIGR03067 family)